jgi:CRISPR-associated exonuclease Cas4
MKKITGIMFYYYYICHRKLWLFTQGLSQEKGNENIMLGKLLDKDSYGREKKHIMVDGSINIDFIKDWKVLHEIKKSKSIEEASIWQVKYYIYFLKKRGIEIEKGILDYPLLKIRKEVWISDDDEKNIEKILEEIRLVISKINSPSVIDSKICKKCAYYDFCYI